MHTLHLCLPELFPIFIPKHHEHPPNSAAEVLYRNLRQPRAKPKHRLAPHLWAPAEPPFQRSSQLDGALPDALS